jgi:hypothetical protein
MLRFAMLLLASAVIALSSGCVTRRYLITSDPPGAIVYMDGQPLGPTPLERPFVYYGKYRFRLVKDGYEIADVEQELVPPYYQWVGADFFFENLFPWTLRDLQPLHVQMVKSPETTLPLDVERALELRSRGQQLQPVEYEQIRRPLRNRLFGDPVSSNAGAVSTGAANFVPNAKHPHHANPAYFTPMKPETQATEPSSLPEPTPGAF